MANEEIQKLVDECASKHAAHVIDVVVRGAQQKTIVEIFVDAETGVTSDLCSEISREVATVLDSRDLFKGSYQLVVSSPGIERPLKFPWQYKKHVGRKLAFKIQTENGPLDRVGKILSVDDDSVTLEMASESANIRFNEISEAVVKAPW